MLLQHFFTILSVTFAFASALGEIDDKLHWKSCNENHLPPGCHCSTHYYPVLDSKSITCSNSQFIFPKSLPVPDVITSLSFVNISFSNTSTLSEDNFADASFRNLRALTLDQTNVERLEFRHIFQRLPHLTSLYLTGNLKLNWLHPYFEEIFACKLKLWSFQTTSYNCDNTTELQWMAHLLEKANVGRGRLRGDAQAVKCNNSAKPLLQFYDKSYGKAGNTVCQPMSRETATLKLFPSAEPLRTVSSEVAEPSINTTMFNLTTTLSGVSNITNSSHPQNTPTSIRLERKETFSFFHGYLWTMVITFAAIVMLSTIAGIIATR